MAAKFLEKYKASFRGDLVGGLTAAIISLPMGLAFGIQSGLGAEAGLYTAIILAFVAALIGGTKTLISDPTGPMTVVAATVVSGAAAAAGAGPAVIIATFALAGLLQILFGYLNIAKYIKYMPYPVVSGFMGGIGVIIVMLQLFPILGHKSPKGVFNIISSLGSPIADLNGGALLLGFGTIAMIYGLPFISKKIPAILVALLVASAASVLMELDVPRVGEISVAAPPLLIGELATLNFDQLGLIMVPAVTLAALGVIDTLLTSVVADNLTKTRHNGNRELLGQGLGNFISAIFGGFPGAGATMGTVVNIESGALSHLSGMLKGVFLMVIVLGLGRYVEYIPMSVLSGILVTIGIGIIDIKGIKLLLKVPKADAIILLLTLFITVFDNLLNAVAVGALLSTVFFMKKMSDVMNELNQEGELKDFTKDDKLPEELQTKVYVFSLDGPLFFGFADQFREFIKSIDEVYCVIIQMKRVPFMDETGLLVLEEGIRELRTKGIDMYITGANEAIYQQFEKVGIPGGLIDEDHFYPYFSHCIKFIKHKYKAGDLNLTKL